MVREVRERERNARVEAVGGINEDIENQVKELYRSKDKAGTDRAILTSAETKTHRLASNIDGVRERSKGVEANQRDSVDREDSTSGRERDEGTSS